MSSTPILKSVDAVLVKVPDIESGLNFYCQTLGQKLLWKKDQTAAVSLGESELVLSTTLDPETDLLVESVPNAVALIVQAGGAIVAEPKDIEVGKVAVVTDPFGNLLVLVDLSKGLYQTDAQGNVTSVE